MPSLNPFRPALRSIFCNRSLNLRTIRAVGYDLDYTLVHYAVEAWERAAYESLRRKLVGRGWPVGGLEFDPASVTRGLIIDRERGNLLKANRFGYVKHAAHGTRPIAPEAKKAAYARSVVSTAEPRYALLNTLFSISEAAMYAQAVDLLDAHAIPEVLGYADLHQVILSSLDEAHIEGELKAEIMTRPDRYVEVDPELGATLMDQKAAGLRLMVITNADWAYARFMLGYALDPHLPEGMTWRDVFDLVIVSARKPDFFGAEDLPTFEVTGGGELLSPRPGGIAADGIFVGGNAAMVERYLGLDGAEILFVGDHVYADVLASKRVRRWRTALILREIEDELLALEAFAADQVELAHLMEDKARIEDAMAQVRLHVRRAEADAERGARDAEGGAPQVEDHAVDRRAPIDRTEDHAVDLPALIDRMDALELELADLDGRIAPLAARSDALGNARWGPIMRAGNDKSYLSRQIEEFADVYTSRVSNFRPPTPYANFRSPYGSLPHDPGPASRMGPG